MPIHIRAHFGVALRALRALAVGYALALGVHSRIYAFRHGFGKVGALDANINYLYAKLRELGRHRVAHAQHYRLARFFYHFQLRVQPDFAPQLRRYDVNRARRRLRLADGGFPEQQRIGYSAARIDIDHKAALVFGEQRIGRRVKDEDALVKVRDRFYERRFDI